MGQLRTANKRHKRVIRQAQQREQVPVAPREPDPAPARDAG